MTSSFPRLKYQERGLERGLLPVLEVTIADLETEVLALLVDICGFALVVGLVVGLGCDCPAAFVPTGRALPRCGAATRLGWLSPNVWRSAFCPAAVRPQAIKTPNASVINMQMATPPSANYVSFISTIHHYHHVSPCFHALSNLHRPALLTREEPACKFNKRPVY